MSEKEPLTFQLAAPVRAGVQALALVWRVTPGWTALWFALLVSSGLTPLAALWTTKHLVDQIVDDLSVPDHAGRSARALAWVLAAGGVFLAGKVLDVVAGFVRSTQAEKLRDHVIGLIHAKSFEADLAFYEMPEFFDRMHRARDEAYSRPVLLLENLGAFVQNGITFAAMILVLVPFAAWLPLVLLASTAPALLVTAYATLREHRWRRRVTLTERRAWYLDELLTAAVSAAEVRALSLGEILSKTYQALRGDLRDQRFARERTEVVREVLAMVVAVLATIVTFVWLLDRGIRGEVTLGGVAVCVQAVLGGQRLSQALLQNVGHAYANSLYLGNVFEFLAMAPRIVDPPAPRKAPERLGVGMALRGVTFRYPCSDRPALDAVDLEIPAGKTVALVGLNGSGKSTILKLLCRLYDPDGGAVEYDGIDLRDLSVRDVRRRVSVLFQEPLRLEMTARQNVALGLVPEPATSDLHEALRRAGAERTFARLREGWGTLLGKQFPGGTGLSAGEWQRLALARALVRPAPVLLLDEPTSALDSWAEIEWLRDFNVLTAGRTTLVITHRLSTAMRADVIHVLVEGRVVETGTHEELLARGGRYAASWGGQGVNSAAPK